MVWLQVQTGREGAEVLLFLLPLRLQQHPKGRRRMKRQKIWVGCRFTGPNEVFRCDFVPTMKTHGRQFLAVIGPFRTIRGARFMARYGKNNPHCQTVDEADRLAKMETKRIICPSCGGTGGVGHCNRCNASGYVPKKKGKK